MMVDKLNDLKFKDNRTYHKHSEYETKKKIQIHFISIEIYINHFQNSLTLIDYPKKNH